MLQTPVLIAGGGPVGLVLAHELAHRGVDALLVERNPETTRHPKMDVTNGRSMEHFRRLGIADAIRQRAVPSDHPMSVVWVNRVAGWELARFEYPSVDWGRDIIRYVDDGSLPLEPDMRISQVVLEPVLKEILETRCPGIEVRFGWELVSFQQDAEGVTSLLRHGASGETQEVRSLYLAGCDGAASVTRKGLGIGLDDLDARSLMGDAMDFRGRLDALRSSLRRRLGGGRAAGGALYLIHFRSRDRDFFERFGRAWHIQSPDHGTLIAQNDVDTWTLHVPLPAGLDPATLDPRAFLFANIGAEFDCEILVANAWAPRLALAQRYGDGRVWLAGDSAHQVIPTGGYGMNTGVGDAVALGWRLAALLEGWGGPGLLPAYEWERLPVGRRNRAASARHMAIRLQIGFASSAKIHGASRRGERARRALGRRILALGNLENEALGIELDDRYEGSPLVTSEAGKPPAHAMAHYRPSSWPGLRAPSLYLGDGSALFDRLGPGFTLLRFSESDSGALESAAASCGLPLRVLDVRDARARRLYERKFVLVRPDQHVAWRGDALPSDCDAVLDRLRGA